SWSYGNAACCQKLFEVADRVGAVVEDGSGQGGIGILQHFRKVFGLPGPSGRDHRNTCGVLDGGRERAVEPSLDAVGIHRSEQDLTRTQLLAMASPLHGVDPFVVA